MTRSARCAGTGLALPLSTRSPAGSYATDSEVACIVSSPARSEPGGATDWRRAAVFTMSPATIPWFCALRETAASPVRTPARAASSGMPTSAPIVATPSMSSSPARTARSASSSCATGVPHTAMTASPMNFSITPPYRPTTVWAIAK
jgi:hypothetical protein